jgi:hypothetical protein
MRHLAIAIGSAVALATLATTPALADKAPWCAQFGGGRGGGGTECLYYSFAQCQASLSGMGGRCFQNPWLGSSSRDSRSGDGRRY